MEHLGALLGVLLAMAALYTLGCHRGRGDREQAYERGHQAGHQDGWLSAFRANLWAQRQAAVFRNAAPTLYRSRVPVVRDPDQTVELTRVLDR